MNQDYARIEQAIRFIRRHAAHQPRLAEIAAHVGLSPYHFQRLFRRWVGISPKRYLEVLTVDQAKTLLDAARSLLDVAYEVGLSGPSRLHEQFVALEAASPGEFKARGRGLEVRYGIHGGPFGDMIVAQTRRGVCFLAFVDRQCQGREIARLQSLYPEAALIEDARATAAVPHRIFQGPGARGVKTPLAVRGTNFQVNVWRALLRIPVGETLSYGQLAGAIGRPEAVRAVANAVAANPVNWLIPCHRVLRANGDIGGYRGGQDRKRALLAWEAR